MGMEYCWLPMVRVPDLVAVSDFVSDLASMFEPSVAQPGGLPPGCEIDLATPGRPRGGPWLGNPSQCALQDSGTQGACLDGAHLPGERGRSAARRTFRLPVVPAILLRARLGGLGIKPPKL